jgi:hypothetical protein
MLVAAPVDTNAPQVAEAAEIIPSQTPHNNKNFTKRDMQSSFFKFERAPKLANSTTGPAAGVVIPDARPGCLSWFFGVPHPCRVLCDKGGIPRNSIPWGFEFPTKVKIPTLSHKQREGWGTRELYFPYMSGVPQKSPQKTFYLGTFGCQMNSHDSEKLVGTLPQEGYRAITRIITKLGRLI